jgi:hypothetical protein
VFAEGRGRRRRRRRKRGNREALRSGGDLRSALEGLMLGTRARFFTPNPVKCHKKGFETPICGTLQAAPPPPLFRKRILDHSIAAGTGNLKTEHPHSSIPRFSCRLTSTLDPQ